MIVSCGVGAGALGTRSIKGRFNFLRKFLVSTFDVNGYEVSERCGSSPQMVTR